MKFLHLPIINSQLSINDQLPMTKLAPSDVCKLLNANSMKIVNCKLKINSGGVL